VKTELFIILFFAFLNIDAQTAETPGNLTPVPLTVGKFTKNVPPEKYAVLKDEKVKFDVKTEPVTLPDGKIAVAVIIQTNARDIVFENIGGAETAKVSFYGRITSKDKKTDGFFEEKLNTTATIEELTDVTKLKPVMIRKVFSLPGGKYQIGVIVRDLISGARGVKIIKFQIP
jgi:hypothetical protein